MNPSIFYHFTMVSNCNKYVNNKSKTRLKTKKNLQVQDLPDFKFFTGKHFFDKLIGCLTVTSKTLDYTIGTKGTSLGTKVFS
jgi:hypothetical protein